jgi:hypothetical protein
MGMFSRFTQAADFIQRLPDAWLETSGGGVATVRKSQRKNLPAKVQAQDLEHQRHGTRASRFESPGGAK